MCRYRHFICRQESAATPEESTPVESTSQEDPMPVQTETIESTEVNPEDKPSAVTESVPANTEGLIFFSQVIPRVYRAGA